MYKWRIVKVTKTTVGDKNRLWEMHLTRDGSGKVFTAYLESVDVETLKDHFLVETSELLAGKSFSNEIPIPDEAIRQCIRNIFPSKYLELYKLAARCLVKGINPNEEMVKYPEHFVRGAFDSAWIRDDSLGCWVVDPIWLRQFEKEVSKCGDEEGVDVKLLDFELVEDLPPHTDLLTKWLKLVSKEKELTVLLRYGARCPFQIIKR